MGGLYDGAEVVLGPDSGLLGPGPEQQFINQKMRPGSGVLSVQVLPDGPTRVLQVVLVLSEEMTVLALFITFGLFLILFFQISDLYQRRVIQSPPSVELDRSRDVVELDSEQELEVWETFTPDSRGLRLAPASLSMLL